VWKILFFQQDSARNQTRISGLVYIIQNYQKQNCLTATGLAIQQFSKSAVMLPGAAKAATK